MLNLLCSPKLCRKMRGAVGADDCTTARLEEHTLLSYLNNVVECRRKETHLLIVMVKEDVMHFPASS